MKKPQEATMKLSFKLLSCFFLPIFTLSASYAAELTVDGPITSKNGGIVFPDSTVQTTAAFVSAAPTAYPQRCSAQISAGEQEYLNCYSYGPGDPGWSGINGIPDDYYFLVTDITITPYTQDDTGEYTFSFYHIGGCNTGVDGGSSLREFVPLKVVPNSQSWSAHYESPVLLLPPRSCLRVDGWASNTTDVYFRVTGYLTDDPNNFRY
jgi:hypothetical protein